MLAASYRGPLKLLLLPALFLALLALVIWAFHPGLNGALIFDDIPNLLPWQDLGDINSLHKTLTFVASGTSFPGRPLSLLSFLIDDQSWPPDIISLKRTNLAIHLINACLIFWLALKLLPYLLRSHCHQHRIWMALLVAAIWSLHPLQVSNVSYVIQRMNLLSTLLELLGLLIFIHGREQLSASPAKAVIVCTLSIGLLTPLAILCKENGLLLCAFALLVERYCFPKNDLFLWRSWKTLFLWTPLLAFLAYCLIQYHGFTTGFEIRSYNAWERLLTQGPVLVDYLGKLLIPRLHGSGLYFDNFPVSHSLFNPLNTFFCWAILAALLGTAWRTRTRLPLFSFGVFFYFVGHLMESTVLPLELYFEHRNYLPQFGVWLAIVGLVAPLVGHVLKLALWSALLVLLVVMTFMTRSNASVWGNPELQTAVWYHDNPGSLRTTLSYAALLLQHGELPELQRVLEQGHRLHPNNLDVVISQRYVQCYWQGLPTGFDDLPAMARHADYETASIIMLERMRSLIDKWKTDPDAPRPSGCPFATMAQIGKIYLGLLDNPRYSPPHTRSSLFEYLADIATTQRNLDLAMHYYDMAYLYDRNPAFPYRQALLLQSAGLPDAAGQYLLKAKNGLTLRSRLIYPDLPERIDTMQRRTKRASQK